MKKSKILTLYGIYAAARDFFQSVLFPVLLLPVISALFSVFLDEPLGEEIQNLVLVAAVWFVTLYIPDFFSLPALFLGGLGSEFFVSTPVGVLLFWLLVVYCVCHWLRGHLAESGFIGLWVLFSLLVGGEIFTLWLLQVVHAACLLSLEPALWWWLLGIGLYPLFFLLFRVARSLFFR